MTPRAWLRTLVITAALCGVVAVALSGCATLKAIENVDK